MNSLLPLVLQFAVCAGLILWAGVRLTRYGDIIARKTGLGGTWVGLLVMAAVTSLPELITGASAVLVFDVPDLAAGNAVGSCMLNLVVLALLDAPYPDPLTVRVHQGHVLSAGFGIVQLGLASLAILAAPLMPRVGWLDLHAVALIATYALAMRTIFAFERKRVSELAEELTGEVSYAGVTLARAVALYAAHAAVLVAAASVLPGIGEGIAKAAGLAQSFVGNVFLAAATVLPELVVSIAAVRIDATDMAVGNLLGSTIFNMAVLGLDELLYVRGSMLAVVSRVHLVPLTATMMMAAVTTIGLTYRARRKRYRLSWDALAILAIYAAAVVLLGRLE